jgi:phosphohistidine phosphatase SixA
MRGTAIAALMSAPARIRATLAGVACLLLGACASVPPPQLPVPIHPVPPPEVSIPGPVPNLSRSPSVTFILVPHAETAADDLDDPTLSAAGRARARQLRRQLSGTSLAAVYADEFRRTQDTARPTLAGHGRLQLERYFSRGPLQDTARQWRARFIQGTVLVVGEPEAIASLANTLCDCKVRPLRADETDRLIRIERADGRVRVDDGRYGARP